MLIDDSHLKLATSRPPLQKYMRDLWDRRFYIGAEARSKAFKIGQDTFLGRAWIFIDPFLQVSIYAIVFGMILKVSRGMDNFVGFLVLGVVYFGMFSHGINGGAGLIRKSKSFINTFDFPAASVVLSSILRQLLDNTVPGITAVLIAIAFQWQEPIHWAIILVIPLFFLIHLFLVGVTLIIARVTEQLPDFSKLVSVGVRGLFFLSGVFFPVTRFDFHPVLHWIVVLNPIYQFLHSIRSCVLEGIVPGLATWAYIFLTSILILSFGIVFFWRAEGTYGRN